ncbi:protein PIF-like [Dreissena polymorpha]|uniref:Chitin-binding type-2 domain-containing protein n=1 Tax=Dreissena polymorpha TaxID=45954 RepID=A0A9D4N697_DREPO|nr:protein PIF-like [Dreissena polymorpha]KAH3888653.1 hypothetical protein DPMN_012693 [Dreissena polymorpha]
MRLQAVCLLWILQTVQAQVQGTKDPSVCDGAVMRHGVGFNPHPSDCSMFVQCFEYPGGRMSPVYRSCEYGQFWDHAKLRCLPADSVNCPHDKCKTGVKSYMHSDRNQCGAFWECLNGKAYGRCCPDGEAYSSAKGCVASKTCTDMCPLKDRVPGCGRRPISGAATKYEQYTDNGIWKEMKCPSGRAYNPNDCECSITGIISSTYKCKPDVVLSFNKGTAEDESGNGNVVKLTNVVLKDNAAYFNGRSKLIIESLKPTIYDMGDLVIKMKFMEDKRYSSSLQGILTNGHCGKESPVTPSVLVVKAQNVIVLGAEANFSRSIELPIVDKQWKDIIYIHNKVKLEGRVCGATKNEFCVGNLKPTPCGFQFGSVDIKPYIGFVGALDEISIYRCKPLDAVVNVGY